MTLSRRRFAQIALAVGAFPSLHALASAAAAAVGDRVIVPRRRIGPLAAGATAAEVEKAFGAANVRKTRVHQAEGVYVPGLKVLPGTSDELDVILGEGGRHIESIRIARPGSSWRTEDGLKLGMELSALERHFGGPFTFSYNQDGAGFIDTGKTKLATRYGTWLRLRLAPRDENAAVPGDTVLRSSDPRVRRAQFRLSEFLIVPSPASPAK